MKHAQDQHCDTLLTLDASNIELIILLGNEHYLILEDVIKMRMSFDDWSNVSVREAL
jgi:hypothetical protein